MITVSDRLMQIKILALEQWGDKWLREIVNAYVERENLEGAETCPNARRPMILRAFNNGGCSVDTLTRLYECLGCEIQIRKKNRLVS